MKKIEKEKIIAAILIGLLTIIMFMYSHELRKEIKENNRHIDSCKMELKKLGAYEMD